MIFSPERTNCKWWEFKYLDITLSSYERLETEVEERYNKGKEQHKERRETHKHLQKNSEAQTKITHRGEVQEMNIMEHINRITENRERWLSNGKAISVGWLS